MGIKEAYQKVHPIFKSRLFLAILAIKIASSFLFGSDIIVKGFLPFVDYFVSSGFADPYQHFVDMGMAKAFPYPTIMLIAVAAPYAILKLLFSGTPNNPFLGLFALRVTILVADIFIFYVLIRWLKTREEKVLNYYWASPILFYINYFHGQLDVIPIAALFVSLVLMFRGKLLLSAIAIGAAIAAKTSILLALPLTALYVWKNKSSLKETFTYLLTSCAAYILLILPFIYSQGFVKMVFGASEQFRLFDLAINLGFQNIVLLAAPAAYLFMLFNVASYEKLNKDAFIMSMALTFTVVVILVPPSPGWYYWAIPFLTYFFVKQEKVPTVSFWAINIFYLGYFLFNQNSDMFQSLQFVAPNLLAFETPYHIVERMGIDALLISNLLFTALSASLLMTALWTYKAGVKSNLEYRPKDKPTIIGIGGDSGAGKTTIADLLTKIFGSNNALVVNGDDMHKWARGDENWKVFTHLNPGANKLHQELQQAIALTDGNRVSRVMYDHNTGKFTEPKEMDPGKMVIFEGLHPFFLKRMRDIYDVKIYINPQEELKLHWKILRDSTKRGYTKAQILEQLKKRQKDREKFIDPQKQFADIIVSHSLADAINEIGSAKSNPKMFLKLVLDNSIDIDPLMRVLSNYKTITVRHSHETDLSTQTLEFEGTITESELEKALHSLVPNFEEITHNHSPKFMKNLDGAFELFFIYYLSEISKFRVRR